MSPTTLGHYIGEIRPTLEYKKGLSATSSARFMKTKFQLPLWIHETWDSFRIHTFATLSKERQLFCGTQKINL
jgi:hypothetical protein